MLFSIPPSQPILALYPNEQSHNPIFERVHQSNNLSAAAAANPRNVTPIHGEPVSLAAAAFDVSELMTFPAGEAPNTPPPPRVPDGPARVDEAACVGAGLPVTRNPWSLKDLTAVCHPDATTRVVGKPRSSQPVMVSRPGPEAGEGREDAEGERAAEEVGVDIV